MKWKCSPGGVQDEAQNDQEDDPVVSLKDLTRIGSARASEATGGVTSDERPLYGVCAMPRL